jgi:hypothetical protein
VRKVEKGVRRDECENSREFYGEEEKGWCLLGRSSGKMSLAGGNLWCEGHPLYPGQSEPAASNAPVGRSVHWMGCIFSFGAGRGSSQSIYFSC